MPDLTTAFIPLAALIFAGFVVGRLNAVDLKTVGILAIYCFTPIVGFGGAAQLNVTPSIILLPFITFALASIVGLLMYYVGQRLLADKISAFLLPVATGSGNTGYFGLPIAIALFGSDITGIYLLANLGVVVFESTIGFYFINRGNLEPRDALKRVFKLPILYALFLGLVFASLHIELPPSAMKLWEISRGAYVCVGMMIIGIALAQQKKFTLSLPLLSLGLVGRFLLWPILAYFTIMADKNMTQILSLEMRQCIMLLSLAPMAANLASYASQNNLKVDQAAGLILVTTILAVIGLPIVLPHILPLLIN